MLGIELEVFVRREDAERFVEEVLADDPELAAKLRNRGARASGRGAELTVAQTTATMPKTTTPQNKRQASRLTSNGQFHCRRTAS